MAVARLVVSIMVLALSVAASGGSRQTPGESLEGQVVITFNAAKTEAALTLDLAPADQVVDRAFRLQLRAGSSLPSGAIGNLLVKPRELVLRAGQAVWTVAITKAGTPAAAGTIAALGIADYRTAGWRASHADVAKRLLSGPGCDSCEGSGPGQESCQSTCPDNPCSVHCSDDTFACCSCVTGCRCCRL